MYKFILHNCTLLQVLKDRTNYLIVVLCEDVSSEDLDEDMRMYLKTNTYLSRDNSWFRQKLRYAMPQRPLRELKQAMGQNVEDRCLIEVVARVRNASVEFEYGKVGPEHRHCCQYRGPADKAGHGCTAYHECEQDILVKKHFF